MPASTVGQIEAKFLPLKIHKTKIAPTYWRAWCEQ